LESEIRFEFETTDWGNIFGTDSKFSVLLFPYLTARFKPEQGVGKNIMKYTPRPKFLTSMANDFVQATRQKSYSAQIIDKNVKNRENCKEIKKI